MRNDLLIIGLVSICLFPYLVQASELPYKQMEDPDLQVVSLQYSDPRFTMLVVLPGPGMELQAAQDWLDLQDISALHRSLGLAALQIHLPRFSLTYRAELVPALRRLGITDVFDDSLADLSAISSERLWASSVVHEARLEVTEAGSEAAAVTGILLDVRSVATTSPLTMVVNRPFLIVIHDLEANIPLFAGQVVNPSGEQPGQLVAVRSDEAGPFPLSLQSGPVDGSGVTSHQVASVTSTFKYFPLVPGGLQPVHGGRGGPGAGWTA